jgi:hypothetical protein
MSRTKQPTTLAVPWYPDCPYSTVTLFSRFLGEPVAQAVPDSAGLFVDLLFM